MNLFIIGNHWSKRQITGTFGKQYVNTLSGLTHVQRKKDMLITT